MAVSLPGASSLLFVLPSGAQCGVTCNLGSCLFTYCKGQTESWKEMIVTEMMWKFPLPAGGVRKGVPPETEGISILCVGVSLCVGA